MITLKTVRKLVGAALVAVLLTAPVFADDDDWDTDWDTGFESSWGDDSGLFGSDDDLFGGDDDFFGGDDGIVDLTSNTITGTQAATIFEAGSIKIGGNWSTGASTSTGFGKDITFKDAMYNTTLTVNANAQLYIDARPTDSTRMYMKGGINYPYVTASDAQTTTISDDLATKREDSATLMTQVQQLMGVKPSDPVYTSSTVNGFYVKELFTDFDINNHVSGRFGKQTITWGVGYFFSPASNIVNLSTIDPENPTAQVDGPLALKLTGTLPGQNILYLYAIPDMHNTKNETFFTMQGRIPQMEEIPVTNTNSDTSLIRNTALAAKTELVFGAVELGLGGWYKYERSPIAMATLTGPCTDYGSFFAEGYAEFDDDIVWKGTVGAMMMFNDPGITLMAQYYYDGETIDSATKDAAEKMGINWKALSTEGSNIALSLGFSKLGIKNINLSAFGLYNINCESLKANASLSYSGIKNISLSCGPTLQWTDFSTDPTISVKLSATLGGGKF